MEELTFILWKWTGWRKQIYTSERVNIFCRMLRANLSIPHKIICITDDLDEQSIVQVLKYMYGMKINLSNNIIDIVMKFEIVELVYDCCKIWSHEKFKAQFLMAVETVSVLLPSLEKYLNEKITEISDIDNLLLKLPALYFVGLLSSPDLKCDEDFRYKIANSYVMAHTALNLMSSIKLTLLSKKILVHEAGKNPLINKTDYYRALENLQCDVKESRRTDHVFFIGKHDKKYEGYTVVTDFETIMSKFIIEYRKHFGIISIDDMDVNFLCVDKHITKIDTYFLGKNEHYVKKGEIVAFHSMNDHCCENISKLCRIKLTEDKMYAQKKYDHTHNVNLFMKDS